MALPAIAQLLGGRALGSGAYARGGGGGGASISLKQVHGVGCLKRTRTLRLVTADDGGGKATRKLWKKIEA
jgi:hypothetical protein